MADVFIPQRADGKDVFIPQRADGKDVFIPQRADGEEDKSDQTVIGSIARGAGAGVVDIVQGIAELGTSVATSTGLLDGEQQQDTTKFFEDVKTNLGLTPERTAGKIVETVVNYGAPGVGVFSWVSKADKARRALKAGTKIPDATKLFGKSAQKFGRSKAGNITKTRTGRAVATTVGTGIADVFVSPSSMTTLADSWDAMPDFLETEGEQGLTGKSLAAVRLKNKFRLGAEGMLFNAAGESLLPVVGGVFRSAAKVPGVPTFARGISSGLDYLGSKASSLKIIKNNFTSDGSSPAEIGFAVRTAQGMSEADEAAAGKLLNNYDKAVKKAIGFQMLPGRGKTKIQSVYNDTMDYMTAETNGVGDILMPADVFKNKYGKKVLNAVDEMREQVVSLTKEFESSVKSAPNLSPARKADLITQFAANNGSYLRRMYEVNLDPKKFASIDPQAMPEYKSAKKQLMQIIQNKKPYLGSDAAEREADSFISDMFGKNAIKRSGFSPEAVQAQSGKNFAKGAQEVVGRTSLFKLSTGMLIDRNNYLNQASVLREMMGEVRNPREAFLRTVDDISNTRSSQRLFDNVFESSPSSVNPGRALSYDEAVTKINATPNARPFVIDGAGLTDNQITSLKEMNYTQLGEAVDDNPFGGKYGSLSGNFVPNEISNSLTTPGRSMSAVQDILAVSLQLKGMSQMTKTVLNPLSQVRNFLSNAFVVGANGLLGRDMGLLESGNVLVANLLDSPEQFKLLQAMGREGAIGQNIQLNELRSLMKEQTGAGISSMLNKGAKLARKTPGAGKVINLMEKTYQLGDDYWKVVGVLGEKARYGAAFRKAGMDIENLPMATQEALQGAGLASRTSSIADTSFSDMLAIDLVKQTMPTYSMVPEFIKGLRRIPVMGNFISFPAEIIRTSGNIVNRSVKELGFKPTQQMIAAIGQKQADIFAKQVRAIGAERLSGYLSMAVVAPGAMRDASHSMLGITEAEEDMLTKSAPPWSAGNTLSYISKPDEDLNAEAVDLSYMLPYEFMLAPARALWEAYQEKGEIGANTAEQVRSGMWAAFTKFAEPFASEGLAAERILDVTIRDGKTQTGASIYEEAELYGDKLSKSLNHVVGAFIPGIIENFTTVKGGEFSQGRISRAITGTPSKSGDAYTVAEEAGTMLTGLRPMKVNIGRSLSYDAGAYSAARSSAVKLFTGIADDNDVTKETVINAYVKANASRRRQQAILKSNIDSALAAGMTKRQIRKALSNTGVSKKELNFIFKNKYDPLTISRSLLREVSNEVNQKEENRILKKLPKQEINEIRRSLRNTQIIPDEVPVSTEPAFVPQRTNEVISTAPNLVPSPVIIPTPVTKTNTNNAGPNNLIQRARSKAPSLLGNNPLNNQIAERQINNQKELRNV